MTAYYKKRHENGTSKVGNDFYKNTAGTLNGWNKTDLYQTLDSTIKKQTFLKKIL